MAEETCPRCGGPLGDAAGATSEQPGGQAGAVCAHCGAPIDTEVVADPAWVDTYTASADEQADRVVGDQRQGDLVERIGAEVELDPLTAATLIVAEEEKRVVE